MKPTDAQLMANAGILADTPLWVSELALALTDPDGFAEVIRDERLIRNADLADTFTRFDAALRASRMGVDIAGLPRRETLEAALLARFCEQCLEEGARRGVALMGWDEGELARLSGGAKN